MLVGILSFPVLVMRLSEAGLAARLRTPLASGHLGALVSLESVSLQSWPCVSCPGRLGSRGPCGERGSCSLTLRWPWRASPASVGRGQAWLPSCSAPRVPLCRNPQKLPVCGHRASRSPSRSAHPGLCPWPVCTFPGAHMCTHLRHISLGPHPHAHTCPPVGALVSVSGRLLVWSGVREALSQARGKQVAGRLPHLPCVSSSITGGPGHPSLWPCEHSHHPGGPRTASPAGTEPGVLAVDPPPGSSILGGPSEASGTLVVHVSRVLTLLLPG